MILEDVRLCSMDHLEETYFAYTAAQAFCSSNKLTSPNKSQHHITEREVDTQKADKNKVRWQTHFAPISVSYPPKFSNPASTHNTPQPHYVYLPVYFFFFDSIDEARSHCDDFVRYQ